jgi:hypothetical protein
MSVGGKPEQLLRVCSGFRREGKDTSSPNPFSLRDAACWERESVVRVASLEKGSPESMQLPVSDSGRIFSTSSLLCHCWRLWQKGYAATSSTVVVVGGDTLPGSGRGDWLTLIRIAQVGAGNRNKCFAFVPVLREADGSGAGLQGGGDGEQVGAAGGGDLGVG